MLLPFGQRPNGGGIKAKPVLVKQPCRKNRKEKKKKKKKTPQMDHIIIGFLINMQV